MKGPDVAIDEHPVIAMIPARLASTRFPRKALASQTGMPLFGHVAQAATQAAVVDEVVVATDSPEIVAAAEALGVRAVLTRQDHPNGASRIAQACELLSISDDSCVVNVQGDEPEIEPGAIDAVVQALAASSAPMATIASPFGANEDPRDPNIVKVVLNRAGEAMCFSRSFIPFDRDGAGALAPLKHVGLYAYRRPFLRTYVSLAPTPMEQAERLEQLRVLEHGHRIAVAVRPCEHHGVDTSEQYADFVKRWNEQS